ncbi:radical SAM protein [Thermodesulforhabdus norvegica]|uniref:Pyruvate formate lyase activating enzyme n=1 Tax=Thermodesulforhabdus norvegica TaxID=39841 RepID=A0A1I4T512_9BACT|nr:radical SAM protein [Thermodesulforhabdus norvegica]SFM71848.1 pyruvate formate lyase activating enzyme [Thermodesulforhabdus norvegica]
MLICSLCGSVFQNVGKTPGVCSDCIRNRWEEARGLVEGVHRESRKRFNLPARKPCSDGGRECKICVRRCVMGEGDVGWCGVRKGSKESFSRDGNKRALVSAYFDPLPTNCVADWVCAGGTGSGYPEFAYEPGPEVGYYNLAVFFEACNLNCLFCQNWSFKVAALKGRWKSVEFLASLPDSRTSCVCFFGGDPSPQLPYAIRVVNQMLAARQSRILRICWETNGMASIPFLKYMLEVSKKTGGCIKVDLKAWDRRIHMALCGVDNDHILRNFAYLASRAKERLEPPLVIASTLLVPGYVDAEEVFNIARFIARFDPDIPYSLLAFAPQFEMKDFRPTSARQAGECFEAAREAGLKRVRIANRHLLW